MEVDRQRRPDPLASSFTGHNTTGIPRKVMSRKLSLPSTVTEIDDLKRRITDSTMTVYADMLLRTWQELAYRMHLVRSTYTEVS
jgi:hypothetical protein